MCKGIHLKECHRPSGKSCELYFVPRVETLSILPTTFTKRDLYRDLLYFSRHEMLQRVYILREKIANFFEKIHKFYRILQSRMGS